jgi:hypothetical protein
MYNKHMYLPINKIQWYVGIPILITIGLFAFYRYRIDKSKLNLVVGWVCLLYTICFVVYGFPVLITSNSEILKITFTVGDLFQFLALFVIWLGVIRVYFIKEGVLRSIAYFLAFLLLISSIYISIITNNSSEIVFQQTNGGFWNIVLPTSLMYEVVTSIQFVGFLLFGGYFAYQAKFNKDILKKIRMYGISSMLIIIGLIYVLQPLLNYSENDTFISTIIGIVIAISGTLILSSLYLSNRKK